MPSIHETAYPRLKRAPTPDELARVYTPTRAEVQIAQQVTKGPVARMGFLVVLKTFQRLGYVVSVAEVPAAVIAHIAQAVDIPLATLDLRGYDTSGTRRRHVQTIRAYAGVQPYGPSARRVLLRAMWTAADTKTDLADLINVAIEELVRQRWELPAFSTLQRAAQHVRSFTHRRWYQHIVAALGAEAQAALDALLVPDSVTQRTPWQLLKQEPDHPSLTHLKALVDRLTWLTTLPNVASVLAALLPARIKHWAAEAATLDAARMVALEPRKRMTLVAALVHVRTAQTRDDIAQMFIRRMQTIHHRAHEALLAYQAAQRGSTDALITILGDVVAAYQQEGAAHERFAAVDAVLAPASDAVLSACGLKAYTRGMQVLRLRSTAMEAGDTARRHPHDDVPHLTQCSSESHRTPTHRLISACRVPTRVALWWLALLVCCADVALTHALKFTEPHLLRTDPAHHT